MLIAFATVVVTCAVAGIFLLMLGGIPDVVRPRSTQSANSNTIGQQRAPGIQPAPLNLGWIYKFQFVGTDCSSNKPIIVEDAQVTNFCHIIDSSREYPLSYAVFCLTQDNGEKAMLKRFYTSVDCALDTFSSEYEFSPSCEASYNGGMMEQFFCTTNATVDLGDIFYLNMQHLDEYECRGGVLEFRGDLNGACIPLNFSLTTTSFHYEYPNRTYYDEVLNCSGTPKYTEALPSLEKCSVALTSNVTAPDIAPAPFPSAASPSMTAPAWWLAAVVMMMACCINVAL